MRTIAILIAATSAMLGQQPDAREIIRRSVAVADRSWKAKANYTYTERDEQRRLDGKGNLKSTDVDVVRVILVNGISVEQTIRHNGAEPTPAQKKKNEEMVQKAWQQTPADRAAQLQKDKESRAFIQEVPDAFDFRLAGEEQVSGRAAYVIDATPKPGYRGRSKYAKMFSRVKAKMWVDKQDYGWIKADAIVTDPIPMGLFIARVQPGSHILFEQTRLGAGVWMPQRVQVKAGAKVLFVKNYNIDEVITYSDYRPAQTTEVASAERPGSR
jgi:hypothetical protein